MRSDYVITELIKHFMSTRPRPLCVCVSCRAAAGCVTDTHTEVVLVVKKMNM